MERASHNEKLVAQFESDNNNIRHFAEDRQSQDSKTIDQLRKALDDLKYQNEENRRLANVKQNECDCLNKDIESWREVVERINEENTELKRLIEELESKNKKLIETMNEHIYNKAQNYKQKTMNTLNRGGGPQHEQKAKSYGIDTANDRMSALAQDEGAMGTKQGLDNVSRMVKFQADTAEM